MFLGPVTGKTKQYDGKSYLVSIKNRLGLSPEEILLVDDSEENLCKAREVGFRTLRFLISREMPWDEGNRLLLSALYAFLPSGSPVGIHP